MPTEPRPNRRLEPERSTRPAFTVASEAAGPDPLAEAYERGRREGQAAAAERTSAEMSEQIEQLRHESAEALRQLVETEERIEREYRAALNELVLAAASRIARERIEAGDPVAARALTEALAALPTLESIRARLHPDDLESVGRDLAQEIERRKIELVADERIERGGCVVESAIGIIDATLPVAIESLRGALDGTAELP